MTIGLQPEEIEVLVREAIKECARKNPIGPQLEGTQIRQVVTVIAEAITQNNARIFEALTKAGIKLNLD